nr:ribosomal protein S7 [Schizostauron trachyderma]
MKKINIQSKLINHLMGGGKKNTSEKILLKSFKDLQKSSKKKSIKIVKLALIYSTSIFKLHKIKNKKVKKRANSVREIPAFISNKHSRASSSLKLIISNVRKKKEYNFYKKLKNEIILNAENKSSSSVTLKNELQKSILAKKHYFLYYRWR